MERAFDAMITSIVVLCGVSSAFAIAFGGERYEALPFSVRILLESAVRNCDGFRWVLAIAAV